MNTECEQPRLPQVIQGGMGVGVSSWQLARVVAQQGGLGVVSGVAPDLLLARWLQDGDPSGALREVLADYPDQVFVDATMTKFFRPNGRGPNQPYRPITKLDLNQRIGAVRLTALGAFVQVRLAKSGHDGLVGINLLEKVQLWTPAALLGALLADVDFVLVGAGVPAHLPRLLDQLAALETITLPIDVSGADRGETHTISLDPCAVTQCALEPLKRPKFLAIVSSHVLAAYLVRDEVTRPDGFVIEGPTAGGHNAPPRKLALDETQQPIYGPRDVVDLAKLRAIGLPFWLAGGYGDPEKLEEALAEGATGIQVGSAFALANESGLTEPLRRALVSRLVADDLQVRTEPNVSPTGFPFKVAQLPGTVTDPPVLDARERRCDLSYLRTPYRRDDGSVGYRCPSEPVDDYVRKGGDIKDTVGRLCLCNGLTASAGLAQVRPDGSVESALLTLGADREQLTALLERFPQGWSAVDVMDWLTSTVSSRSAA